MDTDNGMDFEDAITLERRLNSHIIDPESDEPVFRLRLVTPTTVYGHLQYGFIVDHSVLSSRRFPTSDNQQPCTFIIDL
jgi:hypothetical protein